LAGFLQQADLLLAHAEQLQPVARSLGETGVLSGAP